MDRGFTATGYSAGRQMADPACAARADPAAAGKGWLHDCATLAGDSGGPIFRAGTLTVVALASGYRAQTNGRACLSAAPGDEWFASWGSGCANVAVPVSSAMRERIWEAHAALGIQSMLARLGYSVGPIGTIGAPQTAAAIRQVEREMGWPETGEPSAGLYKVLQLRPAGVR